MKVNSVFKIALFLLILTACSKEKSDVTPEIETGTPTKTSIPAACKLTAINWVDSKNKTGGSTFEYDAKNRLVKYVGGLNTITYEYDQNDFLLRRILKYSTTSTTVDVFTYKNEKISSKETIQTTATIIRKSNAIFEYDAKMILSKITNTDFNNITTVSIYKDNLLVQKTSNIEAFEINSLGLITKITATTSGAFSSAGQYTKYTYDEYGQEVKSESVDKNGVVVNVQVNEYTTIKHLNLNPVIFEPEGLVYDYIKGFPSIGKSQPQYLIKKEATFLLNRNSNTLEEWVSYTSENQKVDKNGLLLSYKGTYKTTNANDTNISTVDYTYSGCN